MLSEETFCQIIQYDESHYIERKFSTLNDLNTFFDRTCCLSSDYSTWILIEGIENEILIEQISKRFHFHRLIEENLSQIHDRIKLDVFDENSLIYLVMQMIYLHPEENHLEQKQISFILKEKNFLIQFEEKLSSKNPKENRFDLFSLIKDRLKNNRSKIRSLKIDYLFHCLVNLIIENYSFVLNFLTTKIDSIEKFILKEFHLNKRKFSVKDDVKDDENESLKFDEETLRLIFQIKHQILSFGIYCRPLKEMIVKLQKTQNRISMIDHHSTHYRRQYRRKKRVKRINLSGNYFFNPNSSDRQNHRDENEKIFHEYIFIYFKDLHDQIIQLNDRIDQFSDRLASLSKLYFVLLDGRRNGIITWLTSVSIIFIPLNFIHASFSMNFQTMPPLQWHYAYFVTLAFVLTLALITFSFFKWKKIF